MSVHDNDIVNINDYSVRFLMPQCVSHNKVKWLFIWDRETSTQYATLVVLKFFTSTPKLPSQSTFRV